MIMSICSGGSTGTGQTPTIAAHKLIDVVTVASWRWHSTCTCGWASTRTATVGEAAREWQDHYRKERAAHVRPPPS